MLWENTCQRQPKWGRGLKVLVHHGRSPVEFMAAGPWLWGSGKHSGPGVSREGRLQKQWRDPAKGSSPLTDFCQQSSTAWAELIHPKTMPPVRDRVSECEPVGILPDWNHNTQQQRRDLKTTMGTSKNYQIHLIPQSLIPFMRLCSHDLITWHHPLILSHCGA